MLGRYTVVFPLALLALLALLTFWIDRNVQPPERRPASNLRHDPDYIVDNFVTTRTDINGNLADMLAAVEMKHYPDDDSTDLQRPRLTQYAPGRPWIQIEGQKGHISSDGEMVEFMDNVKVVRQATADRGEMTVITDYLKVYPKQEIAVTDRPVVITEAPATVIHAVGMVFNKKEQTIVLKQRVRAHYERPASKVQAKKAPRTATGGKPLGGGKSAASAKTNVQAGSSQPSSSKSAAAKPSTQKTAKPAAKSRQATPVQKQNTTRIRRTYER